MKNLNYLLFAGALVTVLFTSCRESVAEDLEYTEMAVSTDRVADGLEDPMGPPVKPKEKPKEDPPKDTDNW